MRARSNSDCGQKPTLPRSRTITDIFHPTMKNVFTSQIRENSEQPLRVVTQSQDGIEPNHSLLVIIELEAPMSIQALSLVNTSDLYVITDCSDQPHGRGASACRHPQPANDLHVNQQKQQQAITIRIRNKNLTNMAIPSHLFSYRRTTEK